MLGRTHTAPTKALLAALIAVVAAMLAAAPAQARKPIVAYLDANGAFAMYDAETSQAVPPPIPADDVKYFDVSNDGRYYFYVAKDNTRRLFDAQAKAQVPLPGIENCSGPGYPTVSNTGLLATDNGANEPTKVYDSRTGTCVDVGFRDDNDQRMPELSGDGRFLATNCNPGTCIGDDDDMGTATFVQDVAAKQDTKFPVDKTKGDEHTCIDGDGSIAGMDVSVNNQRDVFLYDRAAGAELALPALNSAALNETFCVLDEGGDYIGVNVDDGANDFRFRLYERATQRYLDLSVQIPAQAQGNGSLIQPPPARPGTGSSGGSTRSARPTISRLTATPRAFRPRGVAKGRGTRVRFRLAAPARARVQIGRTVKRGGRKVFRPLRSYAVKGRKGTNAVRVDGRLRGKALAPGAYVIRVTAKDAAGRRAAQHRGASGALSGTARSRVRRR